MLRIAVATSMLALLVACGADGTAQSPATAGCTSDAQCGPGRVCAQPCAAGLARECVSGCRTSADCPSGQVCKSVSIQCVRCPCPTTECGAP